MNQSAASSPVIERWIFGLGYVGMRVAELWKSQGIRVHAVTRSPEKAKRFTELGFEGHVADIRTSLELPWSERVDAVLWSVGFDRAVGETVGRVQEGGVRHVLASLKRSGRQVRSWVQLSTTGVYGDCSGDWVNEQTVPKPNRESGNAALEAELLVAESLQLESSVVLRLAGIYGPGRVPNLESMRKREPIAADPTGWLNLIHIEDIVRGIDLAVTKPLPEPRSTFVLSDGHPVLRMHYYRWVSSEFGLPAPIFEPPAVGSAKESRGLGSKRIDSKLFWSTYATEPKHGTYESGLKASLS